MRCVSSWWYHIVLIAVFLYSTFQNCKMYVLELVFSLLKNQFNVWVFCLHVCLFAICACMTVPCVHVSVRHVCVYVCHVCMCVCAPCMHVCPCTMCVPSTLRDQEGVLDPPGTGVMSSFDVGARNCTQVPGRAASAPNC